MGFSVVSFPPMSVNIFDQNTALWWSCVWFVLHLILPEIFFNSLLLRLAVRLVMDTLLALIITYLCVDISFRYKAITLNRNFDRL